LQLEVAQGVLALPSTHSHQMTQCLDYTVHQVPALKQNVYTHAHSLSGGRDRGIMQHVSEVSTAETCSAHASLALQRPWNLTCGLSQLPCDKLVVHVFLAFDARASAPAVWYTTNIHSNARLHWHKPHMTV